NQPSIQIPNDMTHSRTLPSLLRTSESSAVPDLVSYRKKYLESNPILAHSPLHNDKALEDILSET
ncbi:unnamed protein product, partial [Heterotrigona itama]